MDQQRTPFILGAYQTFIWLGFGALMTGVKVGAWD